MIANYHTHSTFCDGKDTPEQIVLAALERGFCAIGFSGHGHTEYDLRYCMKDTEGYINEINRLKEKYKTEIEIYLGMEEDAFRPTAERGRLDYIIGSSHYLYDGNKYYPVDSGKSYTDYFEKCLDLYSYDIVRMAEVYYSTFCDYIKKRRPDIIGHFDLVTKFDAQLDFMFSKNEQYKKIVEKYAEIAAGTGCLFEFNSGVISRGYRDYPHPYPNVLDAVRRAGGGVILSSDCHDVKNLDFGFDQMKLYLKDLGFDGVYLLYGGKFIKENF